MTAGEMCRVSFVLCRRDRNLNSDCRSKRPKTYLAVLDAAFGRFQHLMCPQKIG
jgi:hypothetical protein